MTRKKFFRDYFKSNLFQGKFDLQKLLKNEKM